MTRDPQRLHLVIADAGDTAVVRIPGTTVFLDEHSTRLLDEPLLALAGRAGPDTVLLDLGNVAYVSSMALGTLVRLHQKLKAAGRRLSLCDLRPDVLDVLEATRLTLLLDIRPGGPGPLAEASNRVPPAGAPGCASW